MRGFLAILTKEMAHIRRQRSTLFFAVVVPALQLVIFGFAANTTIEDIPLAILDLDGRQASRELVDATLNTGTFALAVSVHSFDELEHVFRAGRARAGLVIPPDYSERLLGRRQASVQLLVDGSDAQVASSASNAFGLLVTDLALRRARVIGEASGSVPARDSKGRVALPIEARIRLLYNPDLEESHFFVPGLIAVILQFVLAFLTSFSIVGERERGTLEQLFVTPVSRLGLLLGKLAPYVALAALELIVILVVMVGLFGVPIHGSLIALLSVATLFVFTVLGLGLLISTLARTQLQAMQVSLLFMLPSVLLSGFVFPRSEMPLPLFLASHLLPVTYFVEFLRGVVLRGSMVADLPAAITGLVACAVVILTLAFMRFHKQLD